jgi:hypothetical protein
MSHKHTRNRSLLEPGTERRPRVPIHKAVLRSAAFAVAFITSLTMTIGPVNAQEFRGSLSGTITDAQGAVMQGATVAIKNVATNQEATTTTNESGSYSFPLLPPGKYTLKVTTQGFKTAERESIEIRVADRLTLDVQMEVGVAESVLIVGSAPVLETGSVSTGSIVTSQQISELPLTEGTAYQLATLAPGIAYTGNPLFTGPTSNGNLSAFRSNGATGRNQITLDGSPNYAIDGGVGFSPPADAVQEFKVQTNAFDAQQGYSAGAIVNVAVKSGSNNLHGSLYYFNRDRSRTANNFFSNKTGQERPERTYHRFGGVVNGPVYLPKLYNGRDRTFFLFSYERLKDNVAEPQLFTVPTAKMRRGDFSDFLSLPTPTKIFDPATAQASGTVTRTAFPGNIIPTQRLNPVALAYLSYAPAPNTAGNIDGTNNYFSNMNRKQNYRAWLTRIDHQISHNQSIFGKYYHSFNPEDRYNWAGVINNFPITSGFEYRTNDGGNVDYTITLSPTMVFDLRAGLTRFEQERRPAQAFDPAQLGFTPQALASMRGYMFMPRFDIRTYDQTRPIRSTLGSNRSDYNAGLLRPINVASLQPTLTKIIGNHTTKSGYDLRVLRENFTTDGYQGGRFFFDGTFTTITTSFSTTVADRDRNAYGRDVAAFLLGIASASSSQSLIESSRAYSVQSVFHGFFFQDDWKVTPKLTLNLGLRYELEQPVTERYDRIVRNFESAVVSPIDAAARAAYTAAYNANPSNFPLPPDQFQVRGGLLFAHPGDRGSWDADWSNLQPRVSVAYRLTDKTVLRAGFGIFMAPFMIEPPLQTGFSGSTPFVPTNDSGRTFAATLNNPFPNGLLSPPGASLGLLTSAGLDIGSSAAPVSDPGRKNAKFARLIFGVQRELPGHFVVEGNFVSAWGYDLSVARNLNFVPRQFLGDTPTTDTAANTFLSATIPNPFRNLLPGTGSPFNTSSTITRAQSLLAFPEFTNVWIEESNGTNRYNALQLQVQKRFSRDLTLNATYTWSELREKVSFLNLSDTSLEDRLSPDDRPHRVTIATVYQLPFGRGRKFGGDMNRVVDGIVGGWQLNGTYEWQKGEPFLLSNPLYYAGDVKQLESRVGEKNAKGQKLGIDVPAIDVTGLIRLTSFGVRNVPTTLDNLRNQSYTNVNLSISKNFGLGEGRRLQFRSEWLNAFNWAYFGSGINLDPSNAAFGLITTQRNNPRDIQFGLKYIF